jgi:ComF family protein
MSAKASAVQAWLLDALLPCSCALCAGHGREVVCAACRAACVDLGRPRCPRCGNPGEAALPCGACQALRPDFDATVVAADYAAPLDQLVLQLKFGARLALAPWCARVMAEAVRRRGLALPELLCPTPLGPRRLSERGYNQALELARPLGKALGIAVHPALALRVRETVAQSGMQPGARRDNIRNAFTLGIDALAQVRGRHIGLVDDVMTSGHTLNELAGVFKRFGAARVTNLVFARTPP